MISHCSSVKWHGLGQGTLNLTGVGAISGVVDPSDKTAQDMREMWAKGNAVTASVRSLPLHEILQRYAPGVRQIKLISLLSALSSLLSARCSLLCARFLLTAL
jgi:hypothetical protein